MENNKRMGFYGSLKSGFYNNPENNGVVSTGEIVRVNGYKMFSLKSFPYIRETKDENDSIIVELFDVRDREYGWIKNMEIGAGYVEKVISINDKDTIIYVMRDDRHTSDTIPVEDGNWQQ